MQKCGEFDTLMDILIDWRAFRRYSIFLYFSESGILKSQRTSCIFTLELSNFYNTLLLTVLLYVHC